MNTDNEKLTEHIRRKLEEHEDNFEDLYTVTDREIERIMTTTMIFIRDRYNDCYYCQNRKRFVFSQCKCQHHIKNDCFYYTPDIRRMVSKNYYKIMIMVHEGPRCEELTHRFLMPKSVSKKIMYESIRLFDLIERMNNLKGVIL